MDDLFSEPTPAPSAAPTLRRPEPAEPAEPPLTEIETAVYRTWCGWPTRSMDFGMRRLMRRWVREAVADTWKEELHDEAWIRAALRWLAYAPAEDEAAPSDPCNAP